MVHPVSILHVRPPPGSLLVVRIHPRIHWHPSQPGATAGCTYRSQVERSVALALVRAHNMMCAVISVFCSAEAYWMCCLYAALQCRWALCSHGASLVFVANGLVLAAYLASSTPHLGRYRWVASITVSFGIHRHCIGLGCRLYVFSQLFVFSTQYGFARGTHSARAVSLSLSLPLSPSLSLSLRLSLPLSLLKKGSAD